MMRACGRGRVLDTPMSAVRSIILLAREGPRAPHVPHHTRAHTRGHKHAHAHAHVAVADPGHSHECGALYYPPYQGGTTAVIPLAITNTNTNTHRKTQVHTHTHTHTRACGRGRVLDTLMSAVRSIILLAKEGPRPPHVPHHTRAHTWFKTRNFGDLRPTMDRVNDKQANKQQ